MLKFKILFIVASIITLSRYVNAICKYAGQMCPEEAPCCNGGWCSNNPRFCSTGCEPENSFSVNSCYPKPGCKSFYDDFSKSSIVSYSKYNGDPNTAKWTSDFLPDYASVDDSGLVNLKMYQDKTHKNSFGNYQGFGATISTTRWMQFGRVTARIKTACISKGVVSSMVVSNNVSIVGITMDTLGDEIDFEWVGLNKTEVQSNYYWNGTLDYTKGAHHYVCPDTTADFHTYFVDWQPDALSWGVDGKVLRTVTKKSTFSSTDNVYKYPSQPSRVAFSIWDGGMGAPGTGNWSGFPTDWSDPNKVYTMYVDWVNVTYETNDDGSWPPAGYGLTDKAKSSSTTEKTSYTTMGVNQPVESTAGDGNNSTTSADTHTESGSVVKKYGIPALAVVGGIAGTAFIFGTFKHFTKGKEY
ncbi:15579_t:CDS:2 [Acaulospora morrowiae]|uniref:15579_t:CDS:1 n=1 Tax=Acaulospora morrowiae TaxID=94023 RepID=A0A9N9GGY1_9GLOM|nr:15579_t:CDS:2 [Acaulospora morrowiae]